MIANRLEAIRAILFVCLIAMVVVLSGCASRPASRPPTESTASPTAASQVVSPSVVDTATPDLGNSTSSLASVMDAPSATVAVASATPDRALPAATVAGSFASPLASPAADATRDTGSATSAVPLFLTVTAPAGDLLEVPTGTAGVTISGKTVPSAVLSVNGNLVIPDSNGNFQVNVPVNDDVTLIEVVASDVTGAEFHVQRVIVRD